MKKKWLLLIVVAVVNALLVAVLGYTSLALVLIASVGGMLLSVLFVLAQAAGLFFVERQFLKRNWFDRVKFWLIATLPSLLLSIINFAIVDISGDTESFLPTITLVAIVYSFVLFALVGITQLFINKTLKIN